MSHSVQTGKSVSDVIASRHSVRMYDSEYKLSNEEITSILKEATLAPSSSNLQPWRFLVVTDDKVKEQLFPIAFNQQVVLDAAATIVVLGDVDAYKHHEKAYEGLPAEIKERFTKSTLRLYPNLPTEKRKDIALIDGGLVSMQIMLIAKSKGYDTLPMGGFDALKLKELFEIPEHLAPVMLIALGKAKQPGFQSSRLDIEDITYWNKL